jgi:hypothetical protein
MIQITPSNNKKRPYMVAKTSKVQLQNGDYAYLPLGLLHDYASIPWYLRPSLEYIGVYRDAFILHDYMYKYGGYFTDSKLTKFVAVSRRFADREMWYQMIKYGAEPWRAELYYQGVKYCGWFAFRR